MTKLYKNILFAAAALVMPSALADIPESSVPAAAVSSIKGAYPNAGFIEWDSEMHGLKKIYEAEFKIRLTPSASPWSASLRIWGTSCPQTSSVK